MGLSLREAAREAGKSKSTILRAIQSGRLSAARTDDGGWSIDPSELFRVYPRNGAGNDPVGQDAPVAGPGATVVVDAQVAVLRELIERLDAQVVDLRDDRDHWRTQAENANRLLTDQRVRIPWWKRLVG